jgi:hypothetical protein
MNRKASTSIAAGVLCALAAAAPASAAPDRTAALSPEKATFEWTGDPATSVNGFLFFDSADPAASCGTYGVDPVDKCDSTLVTLSGPGTLDVQLPDAGDGTSNDWDLFVYAADEDGNADGLVASSEEAGASEQVVVDDAEGNYLVVAVPWLSVEGGYTGALTFTPAAEETPAP